MKQVKACIILTLCCVVGISMFVRADESAAVQPIEIAFPLPWRSQRLIMDAANPQTSLTDIRAMLKDKDDSVRREAVRTLGGRGSQNDLPDLEKLATGNDVIAAAANVASTWIRARMYPGENAAEKIIEFLQSNHANEQQEAIYALIKISSPKSTNALLHYAQEHEVPTRFQALILKELARRGVKETVPLLAKFGGANPGEIAGGEGSGKITNQDFDQLIVWYWKLQLLGKTPEEQADFFKQTLETGHVFGGIRFRDAIREIGTSLLPYLRKFAADENASQAVRQWSVELLGLLHDRQANKILEKIYKEKDTNEELKESALGAWELTGDLAAITFLNNQLLVDQRLSQYMDSTYDNYDRETTLFLWSTKDLWQNNYIDATLAEKIILPYLKIGSDIAVNVARSVGNEKSIDSVIAIATNPQAPNEYSRQMMRSSAITTLGYIGARVIDGKARQKLLFFLIDQCYDNDPVTRIAAVQALARMASAESIPVIVDMAKKEKDGAAMRFEISGIYKAGGPNAIAALNMLQKFAAGAQNDQMQELCEEGLLRLKREGRDKEVKPVTYPGDSGELFE